LKVTGLFLGFFTIVTGYFWAHKPFDADIITGLGHSLLSIIAWLGITWLGAALGRRTIGSLLDEEPASAQLALSIGIGLGLLSLLMLTLGLLGLLQPIIAWGLVLVLVLLLRSDLRETLPAFYASKLPQPESAFQSWVSIYLGAILLLTFLAALAPPIGWDTLVYHLTGPRYFVERGQIVHPLDLPYLGFPQLAEMQFTLGLLLVSERVAPLFHFGYGLLALTITASLTKRFFGKKAAWLAIALLASVPTLFSLMKRAYVDATLLFYTTTALYAFLRWHEQQAKTNAKTRRWLVVIGILCGFCGWVKYTAIAVPIALGLSLAWASRRDGLLVILRRLVTVAAPTTVVILPGLIENWITTGNPVYPFFFSNGVYWDEWRSWWYGLPGTGLASTAPWRLLIAPLEATVAGTEGTIFYEATIGPLLLPGVALLGFIWQTLDQEKRTVIKYALFFFGVNYALWLSGLARTARLLRARFLFLVFGTAAALGGAALSRIQTLNRPQLQVKWLMYAIISITLALLLFSMFTTFLNNNTLPIVFGLESRKDYLRRRLGWYYVAIEHINQELPPDARVLFLWEPRSYHCQAECWPDAMLDRLPHSAHLYGYDANTIANTWYTEGFTHVLLYQAGLDLLVETHPDPITAQDLQLLDDLKDQHFTLVNDFGSSYELYELHKVSSKTDRFILEN
jgi:4-amino-4-deoxy-L-arabinose transferase-like glycosyltransferase